MGPFARSFFNLPEERYSTRLSSNRSGVFWKAEKTTAVSYLREGNRPGLLSRPNQMLGVLALLNYAEQREILIEHCPWLFATVSQSTHHVSLLLTKTLCVEFQEQEACGYPITSQVIR